MVLTLVLAATQHRGRTVVGTAGFPSAPVWQCIPRSGAATGDASFLPTPSSPVWAQQHGGIQSHSEISHSPWLDNSSFILLIIAIVISRSCYLIVILIFISWWLELRGILFFICLLVICMSFERWLSMEFRTHYHEIFYHNIWENIRSRSSLSSSLILFVVVQIYYFNILTHSWH